MSSEMKDRVRSERFFIKLIQAKCCAAFADIIASLRVPIELELAGEIISD